MDDLDRFVRAQQGVYDDAVRELRARRKTSHWMWFVFPQVAGLGRSPVAQRYAIGSLDEARAYLAHPVLGPRLAGLAGELARSGPPPSATEVFGRVDAIKLRSSMTLFHRAAGGGDTPYRRVIDAYFGGDEDGATLALLKRHGGSGAAAP